MTEGSVKQTAYMVSFLVDCTTMYRERAMSSEGKYIYNRRDGRKNMTLTILKN